MEGEQTRQGTYCDYPAHRLTYSDFEQVSLFVSIVRKEKRKKSSLLTMTLF